MCRTGLMPLSCNVVPFFFFFQFFQFFFGGGGQFIFPHICAFLGEFLYVPRLCIEPTTLAYQNNALANIPTQPCFLNRTTVRETRNGRKKLLPKWLLGKPDSSPLWVLTSGLLPPWGMSGGLAWWVWLELPWNPVASWWSRLFPRFFLAAVNFRLSWPSQFWAGYVCLVSLCRSRQEPGLASCGFLDWCPVSWCESATLLHTVTWVRFSDMSALLRHATPPPWWSPSCHLCVCWQLAAACQSWSLLDLGHKEVKWMVVFFLVI